MDENELKPCPFCGGTETFCAEYGSVFSGTCYDCGTSGKWERSKSEAINAWNTRPAEDALRAQLAALQSDADAFRETLVDNEAYCASLDVTLANFVAENKRLRDVIEAVEWVTDGEEYPHCPWCDGVNVTDRKKVEKLERFGSYSDDHPFRKLLQSAIQEWENKGHKPDCPRQEALKEDSNAYDELKDNFDANLELLLATEAYSVDLKTKLAARDAELQRLREVVDDMKGVLMSGVTLMTLEQLSQWEGVRYWLEYTPGVTDNVTDGE